MAVQSYSQAGTGEPPERVTGPRPCPAGGRGAERAEDHDHAPAQVHIEGLAPVLPSGRFTACPPAQLVLLATQPPGTITSRPLRETSTEVGRSEPKAEGFIGRWE
ncbi:hypothetical protein GCM10010521_00910 [Streptomyces rameus]|uniref:Uncharacterized protein n=1 Tax=Streptomyces rameus TaxID=68261 RepID=A0ABP6MJY4_9ACTN